MTTIVYHEGKIAVDGRRTVGDVILTDRANKIRESHSIVFFLCGYSSDWEALIHDAAHIIRDLPDRHILRKGFDAAAIAYDKITEKLYCVTHTPRYVELYELDKTNPYVLGSGADFALAALDFGQDVVKAVVYAATKDIYTGGVIQEYEISSGVFNVYDPSGNLAVVG